MVSALTHGVDQVKIGILQKGLNMGSLLPFSFFKKGSKSLLLKT